MTTIQQRPLLQDMVKAAMAGTMSRVAVNVEAARQSIGQGETKTASVRATPSSFEGHVSTEVMSKLADAIGFIREQILKEAEDPGPGTGPNALQVMQATSSETNIDTKDRGEGTPQHRQPMNPPTQVEQVQSGKANTGLETNDDNMHKEQPVEPIKNEKVGEALYLKNLARLKTASVGGAKTSSAPVALIRKLAEDAINPAQISSPANVDPKEPPPGAAPSGEQVPSEPSDVNSQKRLISSNEAAINYTKGEAKADPKKDVAQVFVEPPLSKSTDPVLQNAFDNTGAAGVKISSMRKTAQQVGAQRVLLGRLLKQASEGCKKDDKTKSSTGMAPTTPQAATGVNAATMGT